MDSKSASEGLGLLRCHSKKGIAESRSQVFHRIAFLKTSAKCLRETPLIEYFLMKFWALATTSGIIFLFFGCFKKAMIVRLPWNHWYSFFCQFNSYMWKIGARCKNYDLYLFYFFPLIFSDPFIFIFYLCLIFCSVRSSLNSFSHQSFLYCGLVLSLMFHTV